MDPKIYFEPDSSSKPDVVNSDLPTSEVTPDTGTNLNQNSMRVGILGKRGVLLFTALGSLLVVGLLILLSLWATNASKRQNGFKIGSQAISLQDIARDGAISLNKNGELIINGQLKVNNSLVLTPQSAPSNPTAGQMYLDGTTKQINYYDGTKFVVLGASTISVDPINPTGVVSLGGSTGSIALGKGLSLSGNTLVGTGINTIGGKSNQIVVTDNGGGALSLSLPQDLAVNSSPAFAGISLTAPLAISSGGTGINSIPANGQLLIGNSAGYTLATLLAGNNISITNSAGSIKIDAVLGGSGGANLALSNLSGVAINATLQPGGAGIDLGSSLLPFGALYIGTGANNAVLSAATTAPRSIALPDAGGTICLQNATSCGFAAGTTGSYIQNGTTLQNTANFSIQSANATSVGGTIRAATSQTADLFDIQNSTGATNMFAVGANGSTAIKTDSTEAFKIQNAAGTSTIISADAVNSKITLTNLLPQSAISTVRNGVSLTGIAYYPSGNEGEATATQVGSDGFGRMAVSDRNANRLSYLRCLDTSCSTYHVNTIANEPETPYYELSMELDSSGFGRVAYYDSVNQDLAYIRCLDIDCITYTIKAVDSVGTIGQLGVSMTLNASGNAVFSYQDVTNNKLKFAICNDAACTSPILTTVSSGGMYTRVLLGSDGLARISHFNNVTGHPEYVVCGNADCSVKNITVMSDMVPSLGSTTSYIGDFFLNTNNIPTMTAKNSSNELLLIKCADIYCKSTSIKVRNFFDSTTLFSGITKVNDNEYYIFYRSKISLNMFTIHCADSFCANYSKSVLQYLVVGESSAGWALGSSALDANHLPVAGYQDEATDDLVFARLTQPQVTFIYSGTDFGSSLSKIANIIASKADLEALQIKANPSNQESIFNIQDANGFSMVDINASQKTINMAADISIQNSLNGQVLYANGTADSPLLRVTDVVPIKLSSSYSTGANVIKSIDTAGSVGAYTSIGLDSSGFARISYYDATNLDLKYAQCLDTACTTKNITTVDSTGSVGTYNAIKLDSSGFARIVYRDDTILGLKYVRCLDSACATKSIATIASGGVSLGVGRIAGIDLDSSDFARIAYRDIDNNVIKYARCLDANCTTKNINTIDTSRGALLNTSIKVDSNGLARIVYTPSVSDIKYAQCIDVDCATANTITLDTGGKQYGSLALDSTGYARIAYNDLDNQDLKYAQLRSASGVNYYGIKLGESTNKFGELNVVVANSEQITVKAVVNTTDTFKVQTATGVVGLNYDTSIQQLSVMNKTDSAVIGVDISSAASGTGTNWSGTNPYTHTIGSAVALAFSSPTIITGSTYEITYTTAGTTAGESFTPVIGGVAGKAVYGNVTSETQVITAVNSNSLTFTPTSNAAGTLTLVSLKLITNNTSAFAAKDQSGVTKLEVRASSTNTALGLSSMQSNTTGYQNTAIGQLSLQSNTTGYSNVASGYSALFANTSGNRNTTNGVFSLQSNTTGYQNSALGLSSLAANTIGYQNTATGVSGLATNTVGNNNTSLGYLADVKFGNLNNATVVGAQAFVGGSNSVVIGRALTNGANADFVGINTILPNSAFQVGSGSYTTGTISQSANTITGSGTTFTANMAGGKVLYSDGTTSNITLFGSTTSLTVDVSKTVTAGSTYTIIYPGGFSVSNSGVVVARNLNDSASAFTIQNSGGTSILAVDSTNLKVTVTKLVITTSLTVNGHIISGNSSGSTTVTAGAAACTSPTVSVAGNDTSGVITVITGTGCAGVGKLATLNFANAFGNAPRVVISNYNVGASGLQTYVDSATITTGLFDLITNTAPVNTTTYKFSYIILE